MLSKWDIESNLYLSSSKICICQNSDFISNFENKFCIKICFSIFCLLEIGYLINLKTLFKGL